MDVVLKPHESNRFVCVCGVCEWNRQGSCTQETSPASTPEGTFAQRIRPHWPRLSHMTALSSALSEFPVSDWPDLSHCLFLRDGTSRC